MYPAGFRKVLHTRRQQALLARKTKYYYSGMKTEKQQKWI